MPDHIRSFALPYAVEPIWFFESDAEIKGHKAYKKAKAGDSDAALELVMDLALPRIMAYRDHFDSECIFVAPFAREVNGDNAIPLVLAVLCSVIFNAESDNDIVQSTKVYHTGADPMERLVMRPEFEGNVQTGRRYILVDDVVSLGGTLAELSNYIQLGGGVVGGIMVLVNAGRSKTFHPTKAQLKILRERYPHDIKDIFGIEVDALTANEAGYLVGFSSTEQIRNRVIKAKKEIDLRLRSKGIDVLLS